MCFEQLRIIIGNYMDMLSNKLYIYYSCNLTLLAFYLLVEWRKTENMFDMFIWSTGELTFPSVRKYWEIHSGELLDKQCLKKNYLF